MLIAAAPMGQRRGSRPFAGSMAMPQPAAPNTSDPSDATERGLAPAYGTSHATAPPSIVIARVRPASTSPTYRCRPSDANVTDPAHGRAIFQGNFTMVPDSTLPTHNSSLVAAATRVPSGEILIVQSPSIGNERR